MVILVDLGIGLMLLAVAGLLFTVGLQIVKDNAKKDNKEDKK